MVASRAARRALQATQASPDTVDDWVDRLSAEEVVDKILAEFRLDSTASLIWVVWPNLRSAVERFASHVGTRFPGPNGVPLISHGISSAVNAYVVRSRAGGPLHLAAAAFLAEIAGCGRPLVETQITALVGGGNLTPWDPFAKPLGQWLTSCEAVGVYTREMPKINESEAVCAGIYLATHIMPVHDFKLCAETVLKGSEPT